VFTEGDAQGIFGKASDTSDRNKRIQLLQGIVGNETLDRKWEFLGENIYVTACKMLARDYRALTNYDEAEKYDVMAKKAERELAGGKPEAVRGQPKPLR